jgi:hypothetical protein
LAQTGVVLHQAADYQQLIGPGGGRKGIFGYLLSAKLGHKQQAQEETEYRQRDLYRTALHDSNIPIAFRSLGKKWYRSFS